MEAIERSDHNKVWRGEHEGPDGRIVNEGVGDLSAWIDPDTGATWSHWQPDEEELAILNAGGQVALGIFTSPIPPVSLGVVPAEEEKPKAEESPGGDPSQNGHGQVG